MRRQLRALLLAAGGRDLSVMFPMVATVAEFRAAKALLLAEANRVRPAPGRLRVGSMLEVPALMWQLPALLNEVDFISIGSNDLLQFSFALPPVVAFPNRFERGVVDENPSAKILLRDQFRFELENTIARFDLFVDG